MTTLNTTRPSPGATAKLTLQIAEDRTRPLNPGEPIKFSTTMDGQPVVTRSAVPMYDSCRVLASWDLTGKAKFVRADGTVGMTMDIQAGAKLTVEEGPGGPKVRKYRGTDRGKPGLDGESVSAGTELAEVAL